MTDSLTIDLSSLSLARPSSSNSQNVEDWDASFSSLSSSSPRIRATSLSANLEISNEESSTPLNSVALPGEGETGGEATPSRGGRDKRSLSELLRLHAEKGTDVKFSAEEAARIAEVLNKWINACSSPYEDEDDFFSRARDDTSPAFLHGQLSVSSASTGRSRGQSEGAGLSRS